MEEIIKLLNLDKGQLRLLVIVTVIVIIMCSETLNN